MDITRVMLMALYVKWYLNPQGAAVLGAGGNCLSPPPPPKCHYNHCLCILKWALVNMVSHQLAYIYPSLNRLPHILPWDTVSYSFGIHLLVL
jgi:hypothetical protein